MQRILPKCDPVAKVTVISRGMALGYTMALPTEDRYLQSKTEFEDKIAGLLGGNVAERLVFGDTTTGASNDIEKATDLARRMVTEFGMSDKLGPLSFGKRDELVFLGREIGEQRNYSDDVARMIDEEVRAIIDRAYDRATEVLTTHRDRLDRLAEKLIAEETVDQPEFETIFEDLPPKPERTAGIPRVIAPGTDGGTTTGPDGPGAQPVAPARLTAAALTAAPTAPHRTAAAPAVAVRRSCAGRRTGRDSIVRPGRPSRDPTPPTPAGDPMTDTAAAPDAHPIDPAVEAALQASAGARAEALLEFARIPSVSALPEHAADVRARRRVARRAPAQARGDRGRGRSRRALHPIVFGADPRGAGRADGPRLLPLRRPARRPARPVGDRAVGAVRARRPVRRSRRGRRQGPDRDAPGALEALRAAGRSAGRQPHLRVRGRGGVRLREPVRLARGEPRPPRRRRRDHQRHRPTSRATCRRSPSACAGSCTPRSTWSCRRSTSTRASTAAPSRTRPTPSRRSSRR